MNADTDQPGTDQPGTDQPDTDQPGLDLPRLDRRYRAAAHVLAQSSGDEVVLLDLRTEQYFGLDAVGGELWSALERGRTPQEVADGVCHTYTVTPDVARADLAELLRSLLDAQLLVACDG